MYLTRKYQLRSLVVISCTVNLMQRILQVFAVDITLPEQPHFDQQEEEGEASEAEEEDPEEEGDREESFQPHPDLPQLPPPERPPVREFRSFSPSSQKKQGPNRASGCQPFLKLRRSTPEEDQRTETATLIATFKHELWKVTQRMEKMERRHTDQEKHHPADTHEPKTLTDLPKRYRGRSTYFWLPHHIGPLRCIITMLRP
ncbi:hypothetical protein L211DRAFT_852547 [Terfezia boudieri ATCC MYA-4762]|uniref:Uncharacterized protein n=1 Tax=Terfezia boudieri ATCC MYA-4762 TaxID=1051890 RepID=A0A3N4LB80_9PEZI|nr:hypothetical protein L211DRAFT_852547 [Terfezia boudieri ATCC MYA-4762]